MKRRVVEKPTRTPAAPLWIRQMNFGLRHFTEPGEPLVIGGPAQAKWRQARDDWCIENGCHNFGKTCAETFGGHTCGAEERRAQADRRAREGAAEEEWD